MDYPGRLRCFTTWPQGETPFMSTDLVLTKVLLGMNPEMPLCVSEGLIAEAEMQETEALLQSVITHWTALRNTSIAGFRSSFSIAWPC